MKILSLSILVMISTTETVKIPKLPQSQKMLFAWNKMRIFLQEREITYNTFSESHFVIFITTLCTPSADFEQGTKVIAAPGVYKICENIPFEPNGPVSGQIPNEPFSDSVFEGFYSTSKFGICFF